MTTPLPSYKVILTITLILNSVFWDTWSHMQHFGACCFPVSPNPTPPPYSLVYSNTNSCIKEQPCRPHLTSADKNANTHVSLSRYRDRKPSPTWSLGIFSLRLQARWVLHFVFVAGARRKHFDMMVRFQSKHCHSIGGSYSVGWGSLLDSEKNIFLFKVQSSMLMLN